MNAPADTTLGVRFRDCLWMLALAAALGSVYVWDRYQGSVQVVSVSGSGGTEVTRSAGDLLTPAAPTQGQPSPQPPLQPSVATEPAESPPLPAEPSAKGLAEGELPVAREAERVTGMDVPTEPKAAQIALSAPPNAQIETQAKPNVQIQPELKAEVARTIKVVPQEEPPAKKPEPARPEVQFFHTTAEAKSVAYVVDCSGSMAGRRFERAQAELNQSVGRLEAGQRFHVSFFNSGALPMFNDRQPASLSVASPAMKTRLHEWMDQIRAGGGTRPDAALQIAARLQPDVIYLLSDGEFPPLSAPTKELIQVHKIVVHTIAFESSGGGQLLEEIATWSGGTYRFVPANAAALRFDFATRLSGDNEARLQRIIAGAPDAWELAHGAGQAAPGLMEEMFELLRDPDPRLRQDVRKGLSFLTGDVDFALPDNAGDAERDAVVQQWQAWYVEDTRQGFQHRLRATSLRERPERLKVMVESPNVHERLAAAHFLTSRSLRMVNHLLALIADQDAQVRAQARQGLVDMADGQDFGPPDNATDEQRAAAVAGWQGWWEESKLQEKLRLARMMADANPAAAARRLEEIIRERPDSATAKEAQAMLAQIGKSAPAPDPTPPAVAGTKIPRRSDRTEGPAAKGPPVQPTEEDERLAEKTLRLAVQFLARDPQALQERLREIIQRHPGTRAAQAAEKHLEKISP